MHGHFLLGPIQLLGQGFVFRGHMPKSSWYGVRDNSVPSDLTHLLLRLDTESKVTPHTSFIALAARKLQGSFLSQMHVFLQ